MNTTETELATVPQGQIAGPASKPGRRKNVNRVAIDLIGCAGLSALHKADLFIVSGETLRKLTESFPSSG